MPETPGKTSADQTPDRPQRDLQDDWPLIARILDANANRAVEGLRVLEDCFRFGRDDPFLSGQLKQLRHGLAAALQLLPRQDYLLARETEGDVGRSIVARGEYDRESLAEIVEANIRRVQQALRSLEEYSKPVSVEAASRLEQIRYQSYILHRAMFRSQHVQQRLLDSRLHVLIDATDSDLELQQQIKELAVAPIDMIQLRDKQLDDRLLMQRAGLVRRTLDQLQATRQEIPLLIINDRPDIARASSADGVHLGQDDMTVTDARKIVGPDVLVGVSTHSIEQARQAVLEGADYLGCGPTFPGRTKQFDSFPGPAFLEQVSSEIRLPAFAIGGITLENLDEVLETGMRRVAVAGAISNSDLPAEVAGQLQDRLLVASSWQ